MHLKNRRMVLASKKQHPVVRKLEIVPIYLSYELNEMYVVL